jgi:catechol 2,3-dioxygenase-like lactoylglutathione lyase family enzyme
MAITGDICLIVHQRELSQEDSMMNQGLHHLGLATHDMEATLAFYEDVLGFQLKVTDILSPQTGGKIRHAFLDAGNGEMVAFMECNDVKGIAKDFDPGINKGLGIAGGMIHFAFKSATEADLESKRSELAEKGVDVTDVVDHGWCKSIYFHDPNNLQLEYCTTTETNFNESHLEDGKSSDWQSLARDSGLST